MIARFRRLYGASPLHLLALVASFGIAGAAVSGWFDRSSDVGAVLVWFVAAIVAHDFVLLPLYSALDWIAFGRRDPDRTDRRSLGARPPAPRGVVYVRVPALLSALLLLVFFPEIFKLGSGSFHLASGMGQGVYLARWLAATGALFALSGVAYALALGRRRRLAAAPDSRGSGGRA
jgi:hypothetical protein